MAHPLVLSIAGYDPSSGAGVTADVKTAVAHGCYAITCITALTVQTTERVFAVEPVREDLVRDTLYELVRDLPPAAVRLGMLGSVGIAAEVADFLETVRPPNVVLDPVLRSTSGASLLEPKGVSILRDRLLRMCDVITPNAAEAAELCGRPIPSDELSAALLARELHQFGCRAVVVTGGHLAQPADVLSLDATAEPIWFRGTRIESRATHGTGCAFAMAIACNLACGLELTAAVSCAKQYVRRAIESAEPLGHGYGPMNHVLGW